MDFRPILFILGVLLCLLGISMLIPMIADLKTESEHWKTFFTCAILTGFFGGSLVLSTGNIDLTLNSRQVFVLTVCCWVTVCAFSALPFKFSALGMDSEDAFFEAVSGLTTTGATVIPYMDDVPTGLLLWRSILQWLGGIGVILMSILILPFLKVGGMQLFVTEATSNQSSLPRAAKLGYSIIMVYTALSLICASCYMFAGMNAFDAVNHAMTTIATGGFSTRTDSISHFNSLPIELVALVFMTISGMPFLLFLKALRGKPNILFGDSQVKAYLATIAASAFVLWVCLVVWRDIPILWAFKDAIFTAVSVMTGTGFYTSDYALWGGFANTMLLFLMVVGGCAGSTTCGIRIFRFQVLYEAAKSQLRKLIYPSGVFFPRYNGRALPNSAVVSVMSFMFAFAALYVVGVLMMSFLGLDMMSSLSSVSAALANVGPGLGVVIGPTGSFHPLPEPAKWILSIYMIIGRLDIFTVLVLFTPYFWKV